MNDMRLSILRNKLKTMAHAGTAVPVLLLLAALAGPATAPAQRITSVAGRGVVATSRTSRGVTSWLVSWRRLAQDPEDACYNLYSSVGGSSWTKVNDALLSVSNYSPASIADGTRFCVTVTENGKEGAKSTPFTYRKPITDNAYLFIDFRTCGSPLDVTTTTAKFAWPCDLNNDGVMDYVIDRRRLSGTGSDEREDSEGSFDRTMTDKLEAYLGDGTYLWTIELGPNVQIDEGHNDMVTVGDFDGDGRAEVCVQVSDGTQFADGKYIRYAGPLFGEDIKADGLSADSDGDGIINYNAATVRRTPPQYLAVIDGMTGAQKAITPLPQPVDSKWTYTRDKCDSKGNSYYHSSDVGYMRLAGHMASAYLDGVHQSVVYEYCYRLKEGGEHHYFTTAFGFFPDGDAARDFGPLWSVSHIDNGLGLFHQLRIADVDGDGRDEVANGVCVIDHDGRNIIRAGIQHGDRFCLGDIDPERKGLECFAIQQNSDDMLGQVLYEAGTGVHIKDWYCREAFDVGRGQCMDVDPSRKGLEMWSLMGNLYDCKGNLAWEQSNTNYLLSPAEDIWWDGELDREQLTTSSGAQRQIIRKFDRSYKGTNLKHFAEESGEKARCWSSRFDMVADCIGDWREEVMQRWYEDSNGDGTDDCVGVVFYTTDRPTDVDNIHWLMQDGAYHGQTTCRGYVQSPMTGFYLGYDMPRPPLPPYVTADRTWGASDSEWRQTEGSVLFPLTGNKDVRLSGRVTPSDVYFIVPSGSDYTVGGGGSVAATGRLWKSGDGTVTVNADISAGAGIIVSEGTLCLNGKVASDIILRARGRLTGDYVMAEGCTVTREEDYLYVDDQPTVDTSDLVIDRDTRLDFTEPAAVLDRKIVLNADLTVNTASGVVLAMKRQITGPGRLIKTGKGQVNLMFADSRTPAANDWTGGLVINEGSVCQGTCLTTFGAGPITVKRGTIRQFYNTAIATQPSFDYDVCVADEADSLDFILSGRTTVTGRWSGRGTVCFAQTYSRGDVKGDWTDFKGVMTCRKNVDGSDYDVLRLAQPLKMPDGTLRLPAGMTAACSSANAANTIGELHGGGRWSNGKWTVGGRNFGSETVVGEARTWTFNRHQAGEVIADELTDMSGLYLHYGPGAAQTLTALPYDAVLSFGDGTRQSVSVIALSGGADCLPAISTNDPTAGSTAAGDFCLGVNVGRPGTLYVQVAPDGAATACTMFLTCNGSVVDTATGTGADGIRELSYTCGSPGTYFFTSGKAFRIMGVRFSPAATSSAIVSIPSSTDATATPSVYNLVGCKVGPEYKGIVIQDGRKIVR